MLEDLRPSRCAWANSDPLMAAYHDQEWGVPVYDDRMLFEFLVLEGMQAGLNWLIILKKRENFRRAFDDFDLDRIARYDQRKIEELLQDAGIIRNRLKVEAVIRNARAFQEIQQEFGSFAAYSWDFVGGKPLVNSWKAMEEIPAKTTEAEALSKDLLHRGFKFVGPTIVYAHMQATGMVNDHVVGCFRYEEIKRKAGVITRAGKRLGRAGARFT
jgi:DNA-3-methyladenine glycosylase I